VIRILTILPLSHFTAQGRTIPRVILALSSRPEYHQQLNFEAVFVAMSRVEKASHLRLLHHSNNPRYQSLQYLIDLQPSKYVRQYYKGFANNNGQWDAVEALKGYF
jgi:hypothetical protein